MKKRTPFSNGSQGSDWMSSNCDRCKKSGYNGITDKHKKSKCAIWNWLQKAFFGHGEVPEYIYNRMGANTTNYNWCCPKVNWLESWKNIKRNEN